MTTEIQGLDISNYTGPVDGKLDCYYDAGVRRFIVGCQNMAIARGQIEAIQRDGRFAIDGTYAFLYWGRDTLGQTQNAIALAQSYGLKRVWLDCEDATEGFSAFQIIQMIGDCQALVESSNLECGIYTGAYWWMGATDNSAFFNDLPLWYASYWDDRRIRQNVNFGGWTLATVHQYASTPELCGRNEDRNVWFDEEDPPMTPAETEEMAALRARRQLAALCADLSKYDEMLDLYQYAMSKGYLA